MRIALCGGARSGKDTVAKLIIDNDRTWLRQAFGDYMKEDYYRKYPEKLHKPKDREHMISFSQPKVYAYPRIWVDKLESMMHFYLDNNSNYKNVIITDLRQPHEEQWCRDNGFHIVRVHAGEHERIYRAIALGEELGSDLPYHVPADFHIYNDGTLKDLQKSCNKLLKVLESYDKIKSVTKEVNFSGEFKRGEYSYEIES